MIKIKDYLAKVRTEEPLVQCITNFVTVNDCANILLASGASPTMAMDIREVEEAVEKVQALVCNMGAIEHIDSMILAGKRANEKGIPVVLDPVGAGGTTLRREAVQQLIREVKFSVIRGNASEIKSIAGMSSIGSGCMVTTLIGGFCGVEKQNVFQATCAAMIVMGIAGEIADQKRIELKTGNATFRNNLIDAVFNMTEEK